ncbi:hypothetical protein AMAG_06142 [Allomyces macrogynus ATCC 38327]|uniref:PhoD-like phosphatase metallophosphatase domain-containing protein n=1 Tax=Allomyces macrogynus (strain ATCC 38327) TaxID=578462 RepID=A0A0L0SE75_ALLM3|nr:hypothetical protein AMAG_06142 [Allomyces macrogynus ATCC 38327]|eukprot:KNE60786.1 hypothetical protein AMAG_06142 [Allomyces macrogynus ATCC 38327]
MTARTDDDGACVASSSATSSSTKASIDDATAERRGKSLRRRSSLFVDNPPTWTRLLALFATMSLCVGVVVYMYYGAMMSGHVGDNYGPHPSFRPLRGDFDKPVRTVSFRHGVASGDPLARSVILWTKITPDVETDLLTPLSIKWEVSVHPAFDVVIKSGSVAVSSSTDWTVKVDVSGLQPLTSYYYRFVVAGSMSPIGKTRTLPEPGADVDEVTFAVVSGANMQKGYFHVYRRVAERSDVDVVLALGNLMHEKGPKDANGPLASDRVPSPRHDLVQLDDYRCRYAQYASDADMMHLRAAHAMVSLWDDHEFSGRAFSGGARAHHPLLHGDWSARKYAAARAWHEYTATRAANKVEKGLYEIYRTFQIGQLVDLVLMDTRIEGREQPGSPGAKLVTERQLQWVANKLRKSKAHWRVLANQVMIAPVVDVLFKQAGAAAHAWVGYPVTRDAVLASAARKPNTVMLSGDYQGSVASEVMIGNRTAVIEFAGPPVTARTPALRSMTRNHAGIELVRRVNRGAKWIDLARHGYILVKVTKERIRAEYWYVEDVTKKEGGAESLGAVLEVMSGSSELKLVYPSVPPWLEPVGGGGDVGGDSV